MTRVSIASLAATSPRWFKAGFLILIASAIPVFFLLIWLMSRSKAKNKSRSDK
jgi:hypothetical protein